MDKVDYSKFPKVQQLIKSCSLENEKEKINWLPLFDKRQTEIAIAEMYVVAKAGVSSNIPARIKAKKATDKLYLEVSEKIHLFAKTEARNRLGFTHDDIARLFSHISFGGDEFKK